MSRATKAALYDFGPFRLDLERRVFTRNGQVLALAPKTFDLLVLLVQSPGRAFSKHELITALWPDTFVEEANLSFQVAALRKSLGDTGAQWIATVPKYGYRFSESVRATLPSGAEAQRDNRVSSSERDVSLLSHGAAAIPPPDAIRAQLARLQRSAAFSNAPALARLLDYVVECTLRGDALRLKEYIIGVEVFERGDTFDPRVDTIVRVQARRLRSKLREYFCGAGEFDPVRIELPPGGYAAVFTAGRTEPSDISANVPRRARERSRRAWAPPAPPDVIWSVLPAARTRLIGRERELDEITQLLRGDRARLITLTGPGGSGKTRLATTAAEDTTSDFDGRVLMLSLAPLDGAATVAAALAQLLGLRYTAGRPLREAIRAVVAHVVTAPTLLLLDNFEHVLDAAPLVGDVLEASPHVKVLVTSRAVLHLYGEREYQVSPLAVPAAGQPDEHERSPAVQLFVERARAADQLFALTPANAGTIVAICRRLDGLPLAIELAAARIQLFPPEAMLRQLERPLEFLTAGPVDVPWRHQTLRSMIAWSHSLLTEPERRLFRRLAVLIGGFTLEAAEAVANTRGDLGIDVVQGVTSLLDKSLIQAVPCPHDSDARFNMLETLRGYALDDLRAHNDEMLARRALAAYSIVLAEEGARSTTRTDREAWLRRCDLELDNLRGSLDWLLARGDIGWARRLAVALFPYWERRELLQEARRQLQAVLDLRRDATPAAEWARIATFLAAIADSQGEATFAEALQLRALAEFEAAGDRRGEAGVWNALAAVSRFQGDYATARGYGERALAICRELGEPSELAAALANLALSTSKSGDPVAARTLLRQSQAIFEATGDELAAVWAVNYLAEVASGAGDFSEARRLYTAALDGFTRLGDPWGAARTAADLADVRSEFGEHDAAGELLGHALHVFTALDHKRGIARVLEGFARLAVRQQQYARALTLAGAAAALRFAFGAAPRPVEQKQLDQCLAAAWHALGPEARATWDQGRQLSLNQALAAALG